MKKYLLICNPEAANGRGYKLIPAIVDKLTSYPEVGGSPANSPFACVEVFKSLRAGHIEEYLGQCELKSFTAVIAVGGDGTLHEVLNGLYQQSPDKRIPIGLIPLGTGNAFSRELGLLPHKLDPAIEIICKGQLRKVDIASYCCGEQQRYFINIISMGFAVAAGLTAKKLKYLGSSAYTLATLWQALFLKTSAYTITLDGKTQTQAATLASVSNSRYTGTSFLIAPEAKIDDGLLDLVLLKKISKPRVLRLFPSIYSGKHIHYPEIFTQRARKIRIECEPQLLLSPDGEFSGYTPVEIECLHQDLNFLWPSKIQQ